ncbi:hypothetical protein PMZ80_004408 [Knufia obscura]|uniref:F-box domain-containing protein n=2 Tax=Knufia TaxID=430999 RepID=A0AAN8EDM1_9EURO|nr:hypothetical protein PMZ80_004408 [Knufia obscura]KAK5951715.1 hypothetical protein OHC33_007394 [Knufia fluminis]
MAPSPKRRKTSTQVVTDSEQQPNCDTTKTEPTNPANERQSRILTDLPVELLCEIADLLSKEDAVSFALCTRTLYGNVGKKKQLLGRLVFDDKARERFLDAYRRDRSPELMSCGGCHFLHIVPQRESGPWYQDRDKRKCGDIEREEASDDHFHEGFGFGDVQVLAEMERRTRGDALCETRRDHYAMQLYNYLNQTSSYGWLHTFAKGFLFDFRVGVGSDGDVYVRKQEWYVVPRDESQFTSISVKNETNSWMVCGHLTSRDFRKVHASDIENSEKALRFLKIHNTLSGVEKEVADSHVKLTVNADSTWAHLGLHQCKYCPTEYRLDLGTASDSVLGIVLPKWMRLGSGRSREDGLWPKHLRPSFLDRPVPYTFEAGSIMAAFEGVPDQELYRPSWHTGLEQMREQSTPSLS